MPLLYTKGYLVANEGSNIGNWITSQEGFYHLGETGNYEYYCPNCGHTLPRDATYCEYCQQEIQVRKRKEAIKDLWLSPQGIERNGNLGGDDDHIFVIYANDNFGVTPEGKMYARAGEIGGCLIDNDHLIIPNANIESLSISKITTGTNSASMTFNGSITCNNFTARNSGYISGWKIGYDQLGTGDTFLGSNGNFGFYNNHRVFAGDNGSVTLNAQAGRGIILCDGMTSPTDGNVTVAASASNKIRLVSTSHGIQIRVPATNGISIGPNDNDVMNGFSGTIEDVDIAYKAPVDLVFRNGLLVEVRTS